MLRKMTLGLGLALLLALALGRPAQAQTETPSPPPAEGLQLFTRYPSQEMAIGQTLNIPLTLRADEAQVVSLTTEEAPAGWTASFRGDGRTVSAAYVTPGEDTPLELRLEAPADVEPGSYSLTVVGQGAERVELPISLMVAERDPAELSLAVDLPVLRGAPDAAFRYNADLVNEGDEDLSVSLAAEAPEGFEVSFALAGQDVTSVPLAAGETKRLTIEAQPFAELAAGPYPITISAQGGAAEATAELVAEVTGRADLSLASPDGRLSAEAQVGEPTSIRLFVDNLGTAVATNVTLSASPPAGWTVELQPEVVEEIAA
ncbi:MAG: NEW3 domain-containing protein, partial [Candidatus Promineifilaceae bacterium]